MMPTKYEDIWTAAKGFYKLEPIVADGGELIIYAPHHAGLGHASHHHQDRLPQPGLLPRPPFESTFPVGTFFAQYRLGI